MRRVEAVSVSAPADLPHDVLRLHAPTACLVVWDASTATPAEVSQVAAWVIATGPSLVCAWGPDCGRVHDMVDEELVGDGSNTNSLHVLTTWHRTETLHEALLFAATTERPGRDTSLVQETLLVVCLGSERWSDQVFRCVADQELLPAIAVFWDWFNENEAELFQFIAGDEASLDGVAAALSPVHEDVSFEIGAVNDGRRDFVLSASGIREAFPAVQLLADAAPAYDRWSILAFRPPRSLDGMVLKLRDWEIEAADVRFRLDLALEPKLTLFFPDYRDEDDDFFGQAAYLLVDCALGEYAAVTLVGRVGRAVPPPDWQSLGSLPELPARLACLDK